MHLPLGLSPNLSLLLAFLKEEEQQKWQNKTKNKQAKNNMNKSLIKFSEQKQMQMHVWIELLKPVNQDENDTTTLIPSLHTNFIPTCDTGALYKG